MGPVMNLARDPTAGRSYEAFSEDPTLSGILCSEYCAGVQETRIGICPKHMVCNDKEDYRMTLNVRVSERALREIYLKPFMLVSKNCDPAMFMTSYSRLNGQFCSENTHLLQEILRDEWNFKGAFVSDWYGCMSTVDSVKNGLSLEMPGPAVWRGQLIELALFHNQLKLSDVDSRVKEVLTAVKYAIHSGIPERAPEGMKDDDETTAAIRQSAREAMVLLKNKNHILPLSKDKKVLLIGQACAIPTYSSGGCTSAVPYRAISPFQGFSDLFSNGVEYVLGAPNRRTLPSLATFSVDPSPKPIKYAVYNEPRDVKDRQPISIDFVDDIDAHFEDYVNPKLLDKERIFASFSLDIEVPETGVYEFRLKVSGKARLFVDGECIAINDEPHPNSSAFALDAPDSYFEHALSAHQMYKLEVDFASSPETTSFICKIGYLQCGMDKKADISTGIKEAAAKASQFEQVVLVTGYNKDFECEGMDMKNMDLPPYQAELVDAILDANPNTVVVIESGTAVNLPFLDKCNCLLHSSFMGNETGNALADVISGEYCPDGKLSFTWPKQYEDHSSFTFNSLDPDYNLDYGDGILVGYRWYDKRKIEPLFPFGYGLSYSKFELSNLSVSVRNDIVKITVDIKNVGSCSGKEVVQCYVSSESSAVEKAVKELQGFSKVYVQPGETKVATITFHAKYACSFYDESTSSWLKEKGTYKVLVGTSSRDNKSLIGSFEVDESSNWKGL